MNDNIREQETESRPDEQSEEQVKAVVRSKKPVIIAKSIIYFDQRVTLLCDSNCAKAWGINGRKKVQLSDDDDDYEFLSDSELDIAPLDPGTYEGASGKPQTNNDRLNKWCARECERSIIVKDNEEFILPNYDERVRNIGE